MSEDHTYNGHTNYETWAAALHIDNDQGTNNYWVKQARRAWRDAEDPEEWELDRYGINTEGGTSLNRLERARCVLADQLEEEHEEARPELAGVWADLLGAAFGEIDWQDVAEGLLEQFEHEEDQNDGK